MKVLILANSRYSGGLSGGDAIYESFRKFWPCDFVIQDSISLDYKPFTICYLHRIFRSCLRALFDTNHYDIVYSSSDFLPDSLAGFIFRIRGYKWVAGFYLKAFRENPAHYYSQKVVRKLINNFADMVIVTNPTMYDIFPNKKKTWINGGIDLSLAGLSDEPKIYDAVFCGRIHPSKGIDELIEIWDLVRQKKPDARLAVIGDGDLGKDYIKAELFKRYGYANYNGMDLLGYMGDERFKIYKKSKVVLYPTPLKYDHFSMAPVEAMACGCPMICFNTPVIRAISSLGRDSANTIKDFSEKIVEYITNIKLYEVYRELSYGWSQQYDYKQQSLRVYKEVKECVFL